jgi:4-amino-4-deoxy-L-arabinose transferase-like glycosyltransferase
VNDEYAVHITSGFLYWRTGVFAGGVYNPPLGQLWVALPYALAGIPLSPFTDAPPIAARLQNILLAGFCLILLAKWTQQVLGKTEALCTVAVLATTPEFLAHSALATLDLPVAVAITTTIFYFIKWFRRPALSTFCMFSVVLGIAFATKVSAFLLFTHSSCGNGWHLRNKCTCSTIS